MKTQTTSAKLIMAHPAPALEVMTLHHQRWVLAQQHPPNFTMVVFYRGLHCPICAEHLHALDQKLDDFTQLGVAAIAISGDSRDRTQQFQVQSQIQNLVLGYGINLDVMRRWGLYISTGRFDSEPSQFSEPALFLIKPNGRLYFANLGTHPFSRISWDFLLQGLRYIIPRNYPFRGTE